MSDCAMADVVTTVTRREFVLLPPEIRLEIWRLAFVPRRLVLELECNAGPEHEHPDRSLAFALTNRESYAILKQKYTQCPHEYTGMTLYIDKTVDTLCLPASFAHLRLLLEIQSPVLDGLRYLDIRPGSNWFFEDLRPSDKRILSNLRLITVRSFDIPKVTEFPEGDKDISSIIHCDVPYFRSQNYYDSKVVNTLETLAGLVGMGTMEVYAGPRIVAVFKPDECMIGQLRPDLISNSRILWNAPEEETWEVLEEWLEREEEWVGKEKAGGDGWFIREISGREEANVRAAM